MSINSAYYKCPCCEGVLCSSDDGCGYGVVIKRSKFKCEECGFESDYVPAKIDRIVAISIRNLILEELKMYSGIVEIGDLTRRVAENLEYTGSMSVDYESKLFDGVLKAMIDITKNVSLIKTHEGKTWVVLVKDFEKEKILSKSLDVTVEFDTDLEESCTSSGYHIPIELTREEQDVLRNDIFNYAALRAKQVSHKK
jgi:hypothetical protein